MSGLHFDLHGLSVSVAVDDPDLAAFVRAHLETEEGENPEAELQIRAGWRWGAPEPPPSPGAGAEKAGRGLMLARDGDAVRATWSRVPDFPELTMTFALSGDIVSRLQVGARCAYVPRGLGRRIEYMRQGRVDRKRNRLFFKMMYFMTYYPMAWHLEHTRGWGLLHASAVRMPSGKAVVLAGLGGVGKSTLGLTLLSRPGARLISDNLVFHDHQRIYACPEPVRLDATSVAGMAGAGVEPERSGLPLTAHPKPTYRVSGSRQAGTGIPASVYFLRFAPAPSVTPIETARAARMLQAGNDLAREIKDYRPCAALLAMLAAERGAPAPAPRASLTRLLEGSRCAVFRIGEGEAVETTASRLEASVEAAL